MNRLRYMTATSVSWMVGPVAVALELLNYSDRGRPWRDDFLWAIDWSGTGVFLIVPVLAGLVAADTGMILTRSRRDLTLSMPREALAMLAPALLAFTVTALVHLSFVIPYAVSARPTSQNSLGAVLMIVAHLAVLGFFAVFGAFLGAAVRLPWGPVVAAVASPVVMWWMGRSSGLFSPFDVGGSTSSLLGLTLNRQFVLVQLVTLAVVIVVVLGAISHRWPWIRGANGKVLLPLGALAVCLLLLQRTPNLERLEVVSSSPEQQCSGSEPRICFFPQHRRFVGEVRHNAERIYDALPAEVAQVLPTTLEERYPGGPVPADTEVSAYEVLPDSFSTDSIPISDTAGALVTPWGCPQIFAQSAPPEKYFQAAQMLTQELLEAAEGGANLEDPVRVQQFTELYGEVKSCRIFDE